MDLDCTIFDWLVVVLLFPDVGGYFHGYSLTPNYTRSVLPSGADDKGEQPLVVSLRVSVMDVLDVDEQGNELSLDMWVVFSWMEDRIIFDAGLAPKSKRTLNPKDAEKLWTPEFYLIGMREYSTKHGLTDMNYLALYPNKTLNQVLRANVIVKCKFDFELYPLDIQACPVDFMSPMFRAEDMRFTWYNARVPVTIKSYRANITELETAHYKVSLFICYDTFYTSHISGNVSVVRFWLILERMLQLHLLEVYVPTAMFVVMSWGSFLVKPDVVPGRMVLLVTNLLSLITLFESSTNSSPPANGVKCMEIWVLSCIAFVFFALLEYAWLLYTTRGSCFKRRTSGLTKLKLFVAATTYNKQHLQDDTCHWMRRVRAKMRHMKSCLTTTICRWQLNKRSWSLLDQISLIVFPILFIIYNVVYWKVVLIMRANIFREGNCDARLSM